MFRAGWEPVLPLPWLSKWGWAQAELDYPLRPGGLVEVTEYFGQPPDPGRLRPVWEVLEMLGAQEI